jgi:hypothetical protein
MAEKERERERVVIDVRCIGILTCLYEINKMKAESMWRYIPDRSLVTARETKLSFICDNNRNGNALVRMRLPRSLPCRPLAPIHAPSEKISRMRVLRLHRAICFPYSTSTVPRHLHSPIHAPPRRSPAPWHLPAATASTALPASRGHLHRAGEPPQ